MKRIVLLLLCIFSMLHITACDCTVDFTISFMVDGQEYHTIQTSGETLVRMPENPTKVGYSFKGWFWDNEIWEIPFTVNSLLNIPLQSDMCVYAKFEKIHIHDLQYHGYVAATCEEDGCLEYWSCTGCEKIFADEDMQVELSEKPVILATGHTEKVVNGSTPTCNNYGYTDGLECSTCGEVLIAQKQIAKLPHKYDREVASNVYIKSVATCTVPAEYYYSCVCGREGLTTFFKGNVAPHKYDGGSYLIDGAYHAEKCENCNHSKNKQIHALDSNNKCTVCDKKLNYTDNLSYSLSSDRSYYTLTGIGYSEAENIVVPKTINGIDVKVIGEGAFASNKKIKSVWLFENITTIKNNAFQKCSNLEYVHFGENIKTIGSSAFLECSKINNIDLNNIESIGYNSFGLCNSLASIKMDKVKNIDSLAFNKCNTLTAVDLTSVESLGPGVFQYCTKLESINLGTKINKISSNLFLQCAALKEVRVPMSVNNMEAFLNGCTSLEYLELPYLSKNIGSLFGANVDNQNSYIPTTLHTVKILEGSIDNNAFKNCKNIQTIELGSGIMTVRDNAFYGCENLNNVILSNEIESIGENVFYNTKVWNTNSNWKNNLLIIGNYLISCRSTAVGQVNVPNEIILIADKAFSGCDNILEVICSNSVRYIGKAVFENCDNLSNINMGNSMLDIGTNAFSGCVCLETITIPNTVTNIASGAFANCTSLQKVYIDSVDFWYGIFFDDAYANPLSNGADLYVAGVKLENLIIPTDCRIIGAYLFNGCTSIKSLYIHDKLICINTGAFDNCIALENIESKSVLSSMNASNTFVGCDSLSTLSLIFDTEENNVKLLFDDNIPETLHTVIITGGNLYDGALAGCESISVLVLEDVDTISGAFLDGVNLEYVVLNGVKTIGSDAFKNSTKISEVYTDSINNWLDIVFTNQFSNPLAYGASLFVNDIMAKNISITKNVGQYAFYGCSSIEQVNISDSVTSIGKDAFYSCENCSVLNVESLTGWLNVNLENSYSNPMNQYEAHNVFKVGGEQVIDINIPNTITKINAYAFVGCDDVRSLYVPTSVTTIGYRAFGDCYFMDATFPRSNDSLISGNNYVDYTIGYYVEYLTITSGVISGFTSSPYLACVTIGKEVTAIDDGAFQYSNLSTIDFESGSKCTSIGSYAFANTNISGITIPSGVSYMGTGVLSQCRHLRSVDMSGYTGNNVPTWAFEGSADLCDVTLPDTIKYFYEYSFSGCTLLTSIDIPSSTTYFASGVFSNTGLTEFTFNTGVTAVSESMFSGCQYLERVILSDTITYIGSYAFYGCTSLSYLYLPDSVFTNERFVDDSGGGYYDYSSCIGYDAFLECKIAKIDAGIRACYVIGSALASNQYDARNPATIGYTDVTYVSSN